MKKTWETPKLIVLVRNNPQEAVLSYCKGSPGALTAGTVTSPTNTHTGCTQPFLFANTPSCANCSTVSVS